MAGSSAKKIAARNKSSLENLRISHFIVLLLYTSVRSFFLSWDLSLYNLSWIAGLNLVNMVLHVQLESLAKSGTDLNEEGTVLTYYFDVLYVGWIVLLGSLYSTKFYWIYAAIPVFAGYKFVSFTLKMLGFVQGKAPTTPSKSTKTKPKRK